MIEANKTAASADDVKNNTQELYFMQESKALNLFNQGALEDITSVVTSTNKYEPSAKIVDKMSENQKAFFSINGTYYAFPHYVGSWGISYNRDIFDSQGYYMLDGGGFAGEDPGYDASAEKNYVANKGVGCLTRTLGRDRIAFTEDDGLPETYEEFIALCDYISSDNGHIPFTFSNMQMDTYVTSVVNALFMDSLGAEEAAKMLSFGGESGSVTLNNLVKIDPTGSENRGTIIPGSKSYHGISYETESAVISRDNNNGYDMYRHENYMKALLFMEDLLNTRKNVEGKSLPKYFDSKVVDQGSTYNYKAAQTDMVAPNTKTCMIFEGEWWENEAAPEISDFHTNYNFGWMPLPRPEKAPEGQQNHKNVFVDTMDCVSVVKKGLPQYKKDLAFDFMQYTATDEKLREFTKTTNTVKGLNYTLSDGEVNGLSALGKSVYLFKQNSEVLSCDSNSTQFVKNLYDAHVFDRYESAYCTNAGKRPITYIMKNYASGAIPMKDYFAGTYTHYSTVWAPKN